MNNFNEEKKDIISIFARNEIFDISEDDLFEESIFALANKQIENERKGIVNDILAACPALTEIAKGLKVDEHIRLVFNDEIRKGIEEGTLRLMQKKDAMGLFKAVVVDQGGTIRNIPDIAIDKTVTGINPTQMATAMQGMAIQQQLKDITEQLETITMALNDVLAGQHNDRLAKYYAGASIYKEALSVNDEKLRKQLMNSAILMLSDAYSELSISLKYDIDRLSSFYDKKDNSFKKIKYNQVILDMAKINQSFEAIHRAVTLKTAVYFNEAEYNACVTVLNEYGSFLKNILTKEKIEVLYQADPRAKSYIGVWGDRENLPLKIQEIREKLQNKMDYCIEMKEEDYTWNTNVLNAVAL